MGFGVGDLLAGKYRVEKVIGRGGMGVVFAARHIDLGELFAVKLVDGVDRSGGERLLREARASARLRGEHVVRLHDVGWLAEKTPFLVLELVRGQSVAEELRTRGPFSAEETALVLLHAALALAEVHANALVHRDVKASNLLATTRPDGSRIIKLLDFGIAKLGDRGDDHRITGDRARLGSPAYMSPEQIRNAHAVDARTDVWALGVLGQELFTGKPPFTASTTSGVLASVVADEPSPLPEGTPAALRDAIAGCLVKNIDERMQTVADVARALAPLLPEGAAMASRVSATLAATHGWRGEGPHHAGEQPGVTTRDEPTYDPTELSAEEIARPRGGSRPGEDSLGAERSDDASPLSSPRRRRSQPTTSPWMIPAIALPLAAAIAVFATSQSAPSDQPDGTVTSTTAEVATSGGAANPPSSSPPPVVEAARSPTPATSGVAVALTASVTPPTGKPKTHHPISAQGSGHPAASARPADPPDLDDLDRFGGRK